MEISFTPSQAHRVTGVSPTTQRDWRRRGFIAEPDAGWTDFDVVKLSELFIVNSFRAIGSLAEAAEAAQLLKKRLADYVQALVDGAHPSPPQDCATIMKDGSVASFSTIQEAINALDAEGAGGYRLYPFQSLATPFAIRVRKEAGGAPE